MAPSLGSIAKFLIFVSLVVILALVVNDDINTHTFSDQQTKDYINLSRNYSDLKNDYDEVVGQRDVLRYRLDNFPCDSTRTVRDSTAGAYTETKDAAQKSVSDTTTSLSNQTGAIKEAAQPYVDKVYYGGKLLGFW